MDFGRIKNDKKNISSFLLIRESCGGSRRVRGTRGGVEKGYL